MSFKRRIPSDHANSPPGTRISPSSASTVLVSTGIPSLDDVLGGGLPLSCSSVILAPDNHSAYGELVQKYFVSQGIACGQQVCIVDDDGLFFARGCMWTSVGSSATSSVVNNEEDDGRSAQSDERIKIAWRYEKMKMFQTTVPSGSSSKDDYCHTFDLSSRIPESVIQDASDTNRLLILGVHVDEDVKASITRLLGNIQDVLSVSSSETGLMRLCIPALGSAQWGDVEPADVLYFLHSLRRLLRGHPRACASISLAPHICSEAWGGHGWIHKVGWLTDAAISMSGFGGNPSLVALFPSHHGLVQIHKLPAPHTILSASDKYSTLRGLSSSAGANAGSGENNLAFKCTRKRLILETIHLDVEGGVTQRRTTPSTNMNAGPVNEMSDEHASNKGRSRAALEVEFEKAIAVTADPVKFQPLASSQSVALDATTIPKVKKPRKKVAFQSDRPDLYDF
ncbi:PAXNEB-domain-containing protein [Pisolithus croceorrhizus]|nr:PAXNEB-domain-containing protein [Pisolithus croceorrhizus]